MRKSVCQLFKVAVKKKVKCYKNFFYFFDLQGLKLFDRISIIFLIKYEPSFLVFRQKKNMCYYATKSGSNSLRSHIKEINPARLISAEHLQTFPYRVFRILFKLKPLKIIKSTGQHFYYHINMHKKQASWVL